MWERAHTCVHTHTIKQSVREEIQMVNQIMGKITLLVVKEMKITTGKYHNHLLD